VAMNCIGNTSVNSDLLSTGNSLCDGWRQHIIIIR